MAILVLLSFAAAADIRVTFPAERQRLPAVEQTYVIGSIDAKNIETIYVNGATASVYRTGAFIHMVPVKPGTNTLVLAAGQDRLVRRFTVAAPTSAAAKPPVVVDSDDSELLLRPSAWKTVGATLFANRVRSGIDASDSMYFLPRDFVLRGAEVKGTSWVCVWLDNHRGFMPRSALAVMHGAPIPPKALMAPDPTVGFPDHPPYGRPVSSVRICVDAGHGGEETGALSPHGWKEKDVNLMQARAIRDALERVGFQVLMTRDDDVTTALFERPWFAYRERVDAFISVHHNATAVNRDPRVVRHTTTYASTSNGLALATCIQKHIADVLSPVKDAGAQLRSYAVCRNPAVPSCLIEVDFVNLPEGEEASWNPNRQKKVADAVLLGVLDWMSPPTKKPEAPETPESH